MQPAQDPWRNDAERTRPTDAPYPVVQPVPYRSVNAHLPEHCVVYRPVQEPYSGPAYFPPPPVVVNVTHPREAVTRPYIDPLWHVGNIMLCVVTVGLWLPIYLLAWYQKSRPTSITTYR